MNLPEPQSVTFSSLFAEIENGTIKIPQFQRNFVWSKVQSARLLDSIVKGFPIGTFILWKTSERLRSIRNLGGIMLPQVPDGDSIKYVLDGQQRLTSLYVTLKGLKIERDGSEDDFSQMWVDLAAGDDGNIVVLDQEGIPVDQLILLKDLLHGDFQYLGSFKREYQDRIKIYKNRIESYQFSAVLIKEAPIDVATEIFTRLNIGGKPLSPFEIMVAKTYDPVSGFDLAEKVADFRKELSEVGYETIPDSTILQTISVIASRDCRKKVILGLSREKVIETWPLALDGIRHAIDYFRSSYRIPVSTLLPYGALVIPFAYLFHKCGKKRPTGDTQKLLEDFFWRVSLGSRYSSALEGKVVQDLNRIDQILLGKQPKYDWAVDYSPTYISENGGFSVGRAFIKALLCVLAYKRPQAFNDSSTVELGNSWLKQANSRNFHHFFPQAFLQKKGEDKFFINHIANITLVPEDLNKNEIRAKAPSRYMRDFIKQNPDIHRCMMTHLIKLDEQHGVLTDNYSDFFKSRCLALSKELKKRLIPRESDKLLDVSASALDTDPSDAWE